MSDEQFIEKYEELLNKGYCDCNEMNCIDNDAPRRILNIIKNLQIENKELSRIIANRAISDYNIDTPLKNQLEIGKEQYNDLVEEKEELQEQLSNSHQINAQQNEFIEYLEDKLNMCDGFLDTIKSDLEEISYGGRASGKTYIATQIMKNEIAMKCYEEVLSKYKEFIGGLDEQ